MFDGSNYAFQKVKMQGYLISLGYEVWKFVTQNYIKLSTGVNTLDEIKEFEDNENARFSIFSVLFKTELTKVVPLESTHDVWNKL